MGTPEPPRTQTVDRNLEDDQIRFMNPDPRFTDQTTNLTVEYVVFKWLICLSFSCMYEN